MLLLFFLQAYIAQGAVYVKARAHLNNNVGDTIQDPITGARRPLPWGLRHKVG